MSATPPPIDSVRRRDWLIALAIAAPPFAWLVARWAFTCDDAFISFRYVRHLIEGAGLRFNASENPPVEGYSNFLWVLWLAPFHALGLELASVANATSIACGAALVALVTRTAQRRFELGRLATCATALFLATAPPLSVWCTSGLETLPFTLALFASFDALAGDPERPRGVRAGVFALLAALLRADGALFATAVLGIGALELLARRRRDALRALTLALVVLSVGVALHLAWRHSYYGEWLPNTAKVKAGFSQMRLERGAKYVATVAITALGLPLALAMGLVALTGARRALAGACAVLVAIVVSYSVFVGGDFMPMGRFLTPALPFLALLFAGACAAWQARAAGKLAIGVATALAVLTAILPAFDRLAVPWSWLQRTHFRWNVSQAQSERERWQAMVSNASEWRALGRGVAAYTRPGESMILGNVGAIGFESEITVHDVFGLVDPEVAAREVEPRRMSPGHDKMVQPRFFLRRKPTYFETFFVREDTPPEYGLPPDLVALVQQGALVAEDHEPIAGEGAPAGFVQRFMRFDWSKYVPRKKP